MAQHTAQTETENQQTQGSSTRRNILRGLAVTGVGAGAGLMMAPASKPSTNDAMLATARSPAVTSATSR